MRRLLLCLLLLTLPAPSWSATYYLDPQGGSDCGPCTSQETACKTPATLQKLLDQARPGDSILLKRGTTLALTTRLALTVSGTAAAPITLGAYGSGALPTLDGGQMGGGLVHLECRGAAWWIVRDLHHHGGKGAFEAQGCTDLLLQGLRITHCEQECIHLASTDQHQPSQRITVRGVDINAPVRTEGIYIGTDPAKTGGVPDTTSDILIDGVTVQNGPSHECIEMKDGAQRVTIRGSRFVNNTISQNGCVFSSRSQPGSPDGAHVIESNWFGNTGGEDGYAIRVRNGALIRWNVIVNSSQDAIAAEQPAEHETHQRVIEHNTTVGSGGKGVAATGSGTSARDNVQWNNQSANDPDDPQFVDPQTQDYRLKFGSPALSRGAYPLPKVQ